MTQTLRQKFRQPFGYYTENLIGRHFLLHNIFTLYHQHCHAYEFSTDLEIDNLTKLKRILEILNVDIHSMENTVASILQDNIKRHNENYIRLIKDLFSLNDSTDLFEKKLSLLAISNLVCSNKIELLRIENKKLIVSEIKAQYGPKVDYKIELEKSQIEILSKLANNSIGASLIYCIALTEPKFIEIPFTELYTKFMEFEDFNGREFTSNDWSYLRIRIPKEYREDKKFTKIDKSLYNFKDDATLFSSILEEFPGKFTRLENEKF